MLFKPYPLECSGRYVIKTIYSVYVVSIDRTKHEYSILVIIIELFNPDEDESLVPEHIHKMRQLNRLL